MTRLAICTTVVVLLAACGDTPKPPGATTAPPAPATTVVPATVATEASGVPGVDRPQSGLDKGVVVFEGARGEVAVEVEVARTDDQRRIGLMLRRHLADGQGMLFLMADERVHAFWMKNTLVSLDMIFVDGAMQVAGVVADTEPLTTTPRSVGLPSRYVVEVPAGFTRRAGIAAGDRMRIEGVSGLP